MYTHSSHHLSRTVGQSLLSSLRCSLVLFLPLFSPLSSLSFEDCVVYFPLACCLTGIFSCPPSDCRSTAAQQSLLVLCCCRFSGLWPLSLSPNLAYCCLPVCWTSWCCFWLARLSVYFRRSGSGSALSLSLSLSCLVFLLLLPSPRLARKAKLDDSLRTTERNSAFNSRLVSVRGCNTLSAQHALRLSVESALFSSTFSASPSPHTLPGAARLSSPFQSSLFKNANQSPLTSLASSYLPSSSLTHSIPLLDP
ncbi:hypothetical protein IWZ00DRAFT_509089 [Phyllosticta capitalensis]